MNLRKTDYNNHTFWLWLRPPPKSTMGFQDILFELLQNNQEGVNGKITFYLERGLARGIRERLLAVFRWEPAEERPFQLTASQLFLPDGTANHTVIAKAIEEVIESVMAPRRQGNA